MAIITTHLKAGPEAPVHSKKYTSALIALGVLYFMMGFITCLNDTLVPFFKIGFTLNYAQSSLVQFYFFLTYALFSIPAGRIVERSGYKLGMVMGFGLAGIGALLFFPAAHFHQYALFLAALFVLAIGVVLLQVAANPYITTLGPQKTASARLTLIQGLGSIGTTIAPVFGASFILNRVHESGNSSQAVVIPYFVIAAILFLIALVVSRLSLPAIEEEVSTENEQAVTDKGIFAFRNLKFGVIGIFMYVGAEVAIGTFLTNYIADVLNTEEHLASSYVSFYWGGMLLGRLAGAVILKWLLPQRVLTGVSILAAVCIVVSVSSTGYVAVWSMIAVGICNSVIFAIIFSLSVKGLGHYTTRASGWLSSAIVGGAVIPYAQGLLIDSTSWPIAFTLPMFCYLYLVFYGLNGYKDKHPTDST